jgi:hypothetical protein
MTVVRSKWVFKIKQNNAREIVLFKGRVVALGFSQIEGVNFTETHAPVVRAQNMRLLLALIAFLNLETLHADVDTAFLYGILDTLIYIILRHAGRTLGRNFSIS